MDDSTITHLPLGGVVITGLDGARWASALTLWSALGMAKHGIMVRRGITKRKLLDMASTYTKRKCPNTPLGLAQARVDVKAWADEMRDAIPHERVEE